MSSGAATLRALIRESLFRLGVRRISRERERSRLAAMQRADKYRPTGARTAVRFLTAVEFASIGVDDCGGRDSTTSVRQ